jgi:ferritin-like metal-binding protein YciE
MSRSEKKVVQYLNEAHATETGLVRELQAQIAITPRGSYRDALESHLRETRVHATRVRARLRRLGDGENALDAVVGAAQSAISQLLALGRAPWTLVRGSSGEEKVLKNAKDACATEALEIATYTALEDLARAVGDEDTAELAVSIRADEQRMLDLLMREIPKLTADVLNREAHGSVSYSVADTGAAEAVRDVADAGKQTPRKAGTQAGGRKAQDRTGAGKARSQAGPRKAKGPARARGSKPQAQRTSHAG